MHTVLIIFLAAVISIVFRQRVFKAIIFIENWIVYWHANRAISDLVYASGRRDSTPNIILSPQKAEPEALDFFQLLHCRGATRTHKEVAAVILLDLNKFWEEKAHSTKDPEETRSFILYGAFCKEAAMKLLSERRDA